MQSYWRVLSLHFHRQVSRKGRYLANVCIVVVLRWKRDSHFPVTVARPGSEVDLKGLGLPPPRSSMTPGLCFPLWDPLEARAVLHSPPRASSSCCSRCHFCGARLPTALQPW